MRNMGAAIPQSASLTAPFAQGSLGKCPELDSASIAQKGEKFKMKDITIIRLRLENFKGHDALELDFGGEDRSIYGDNATGKTSVYDALTWLLFGKDSLGNGEKSIDIKPLGEDGQVRDHEAITAVEAVLRCDGEEVALKRTLREVWTTRRGSSEMSYDGNVSDYFIDGVPAKKNAFDARVKELCPEELFRMLTSVSWFAAGMKWQDRRAVLFDMAGSLTDKSIMEREERFRELAESMGRLTPAEYKAKLLHQKRGLSGTRDDAPARISECQRQLEKTVIIDEESLRQREAELMVRRDKIGSEVIAMEQDAAVQAKRLELLAAKLDLDQVNKENRLHREAQKGQGSDKYQLASDLRREETRKDIIEGQIARAEKNIIRFEEQLQETRGRWVQVNGEAFTGGMCPSCGQALPFEKLKSATESFEQKKQQRLREIERDADRLKDRIQEAKSEILEGQEDLKAKEEEIKALRKALDSAQEVKVTDMPGYAEKVKEAQDRIDAIQKDIVDLSERSAEATAEKRGQLETVNRELNAIWEKLAQRVYRDTLTKRIAELKEDMKNASEALEAIDKMLWAIEEFTRYKCRFVEDSVNDLFQVASFRLFREQANGGLEERCDAQQGGVPYMGLNNGMKINVGIDIINALSRHYGVRVPLFVDNAEAVTKLEKCRSQVIRLVVSENDKELRMV